MAFFAAFSGDVATVSVSWFCKAAGLKRRYGRLLALTYSSDREVLALVLFLPQRRQCMSDTWRMYQY